MIDLKIELRSLESLDRELARIEYSTLSNDIIELAIKTRDSLDSLMSELKMASEMDEDE